MDLSPHSEYYNQIKGNCEQNTNKQRKVGKKIPVGPKVIENWGIAS